MFKIQWLGTYCTLLQKEKNMSVSQKMFSGFKKKKVITSITWA